VRQFRSLVLQNYGHAGPAFVTWLLAHREQWAEFRCIYEELSGSLSRDFGGNVGDRFAGYFAAMLIAGTLAKPVLDLPGDPETVVRSVMETLCQPQQEADAPLRALLDFLNWAAGRRVSISQCFPMWQRPT